MGPKNRPGWDLNACSPTSAERVDIRLQSREPSSSGSLEVASGSRRQVWMGGGLKFAETARAAPEAGKWGV